MKNTILAMVIAGSVVSAQASIFEYSVNFAPEALGATGTGTGSVFYDNVSHLLQLQASFSGLSGNVSVTHIHAPTAVAGTGTIGVAVGNPSLVGFPTGGPSGNYSNVMDLTLTASFNNTFLGNNGGTAAGAEAAFFNAAQAGKAYWNIHSSAFPGGEIRGFLTSVPEPSTYALAGLGAAALAFRIWRQKARA